jgi:hypothetical protein
MKQSDKEAFERLRQLYAAYGADPERWPKHERWLHREELPPELVEGERDARMVDRLLAMLPSPAVPAQNPRQLITRAAMAPARREATVLAHPRAMSRLVRREWPAALALAASLAVGVWLGAAGIADDLLPSLLAGPVDVDTVALDPPDDLDFDSGGEM